MQEELRAVVSPTALQPGDIIFECPQCGKSLAIDARGAGFIVRCPDCRTEIQVPATEAPDDTESDADRDEAVEEQPQAQSLEEQIEHLRRLRAADQERLTRINGELGLLQAALDRLVDLISEARESR